MAIKKCLLCGETFEQTHNAQRYCNKIHTKKCVICDSEFEITWKTKSKETCSRKCTQKLRERTMIDRYGKPYTTQNPELVEKIKQKNIEKFGVEYPAQSEEIKEKTKKHFREKYGVDWPVEAEWFKEKSKQTCLEKYGVEYTSQIPERIDKMINTNIEKYGGPAPICSRNVRIKSIKSCKSNPSSLEKRVHKFLDEYDIEYVKEYVIGGEDFTHSFDIFIPKYKILIDCDGIFYHGYLDDPDGDWIQPYNDFRRLGLIPKDYTFVVIVESEIEKGLTNLKNIIKQIDMNLFDYDSYIFKWCRSIDFPYPVYQESRLKKDYEKLCKYEKYNLNCWFGLSLIRNFHHSLWHCNVRGCKSPYDSWYDDKLLKKVIANRLIYQDNVDPSKVLNGFNISKIAPKVSIFNPVLAKYLINKYLNDYYSIFDPFSGFSGRMLGASSLGKKYIGQDIRSEVINESKQIIEFLDLKNCAMTVQNILYSEPTGYECLFTCPPYEDVEIYLENQEIKSCDDWIDYCISKFKCKSYLFVVNKTERYKENIVEELPCRSHFRKNKELVILI